MLHAVIKQAKYRFYKQRIDEASGNPRKFWSVISEISGRQRGNKNFPVEAFCTDGDAAAPNIVRQLSGSFNKYFASVGQRLAEELDPGTSERMEETVHPSNSIFNLRPVTHKEIVDVVMSIRGSSAPGWDGIPSKCLKDNINLIIDPLFYIINLSIQSGKFPRPFKIAKVIPIFKSGDRSSMTNYRPISLLISLSKILEKCVKIQLQSYLNSEKLLSDHQHGFRANKNTSDVFFDITKFISHSRGCKNRVMITFLDLAKAFDTVDRNILLQKLNNIGVRQNAQMWFESYFKDRLQRVSINGIDSDITNVEYGVVQGSTLGPLLFLVYINSISRLNVEGKLFLFADDTALISFGRSWDDVFVQAAEDLMKLKHWFNQNALTVNINKSKYLPIFSRIDQGPGPRELKMHSCGSARSVTCTCGVLQCVEQYKYLGVVMDHKLNWATHIQYIKNRLRRLTYAFAQISRVLTVAHCRTVYFAYVQSILLYGILAWGGVSSAMLEPLAVTQRSIIKIITNRPIRFPSNELFVLFPVLSIRQLYIKSLLLYIKNNKVNHFCDIQHHYETRNRLNYGIQPPPVNSYFDTSNPYLISHVLYKKLPREVMEAEGGSVAAYKCVLTGWLLSLDLSAVEALIQIQH